MDPRDSSPDPGHPEPPHYRHLPENSVDGTSPTERFDATLPPAWPYGRHAAPDEDRGDYDPTTGYPSENGYGPEYGYQGEPVYQPEGAYPPEFVGAPRAYISPGAAERSGIPGAEATQQSLQPRQSQRTLQPEKRRGLGAVWTSVILLLAAGVALLFFFLWIMDGGDGDRDRPTVTQVVPADTGQPSEAPSSPDTAPPSESPSDEPSDGPVEPAPPVVPTPAAPNEIEEWGNQLNDDINGLINDLQNRFAG